MHENGKISQNISLSGLENVCSPDMVCFSNVLICSVDDDDDDPNEANIVIRNPVTGDTVLLFKGSASAVIPLVGFAFSESNEFKAFWFFSESTEDVKHKCEVYASSSTSWKRISEGVDHPDYNPFHPFCPYYASIAGCIYWFVCSEEEPGTPVCILLVDMNDNFTEIYLPTILCQSSFLIELEGCLSAVHVDYPEQHAPGRYEDPTSYVEVYKLKNCEWHLRAWAEFEMVDIHSFDSLAARDIDIFFIVRLPDESFGYIILDLAERTLKALDLHDNFERCFPVAFPVR